MFGVRLMDAGIFGGGREIGLSHHLALPRTGEYIVFANKVYRVEAVIHGPTSDFFRVFVIDQTDTFPIKIT